MRNNEFKIPKIKKEWRPSTLELMLLWFVSLTIAGILLLYFSQTMSNNSKHVEFIDMFFLTASAISLTGMSTIDISSNLSIASKIVLIFLIEISATGIISFSNLGFKLLNKKISSSYQLSLIDNIFQYDAIKEFKASFQKIIKLFVNIQILGCLVIFLTLIIDVEYSQNHSLLHIIWSSIFHTITSFCNAGFCLYDNNLHIFYKNIPFLFTIMTLIIIGGLGHTVLFEMTLDYRQLIKSRKRIHWFSLNTKIILVSTIILIALGMFSLFIFNYHDIPHKIGYKAFYALFDSVSIRNSGISILNMSSLTLPSLLIITILMFIGTAPGSCGSGIRVTNMAICLGRFRANLRNESHVQLFGYTIPNELIYKARVLLVLTILWNITGIFILTILHPNLNLMSLILEQVASTSNTGLYLPTTSQLGEIAKIWLIINMFIGRIGSLTVLLWLIKRKPMNIKQPVAKIMVG